MKSLAVISKAVTAARRSLSPLPDDRLFVADLGGQDDLPAVGRKAGRVVQHIGEQLGQPHLVAAL